MRGWLIGLAIIVMAFVFGTIIIAISHNAATNEPNQTETDAPEYHAFVTQQEGRTAGIELNGVRIAELIGILLMIMAGVVLIIKKFGGRWRYN